MLRRIEAAEEERDERAGEKLAAAPHFMLEPVDEKAALAVQPALFLDEGEEQEARENQQRLAVDRLALLLRTLLRECIGDVTHRGAETLEELARDAFAIQRPVEDARQRGLLADGEEVQAVDRVRRGVVEVDVQPAQPAVE